MSKKFWLKNITIRKSPGFALGAFPPVETLGPSLNGIWGPNAVGKSSLARAMRSLIWKTKNSDEVVAEAEGYFEGSDEGWKLLLSQGHLSQVRLLDNQERELPGRNDELYESYWFPLHELLQEDGGHTATFLHHVRTRMQGGVDLDASRDAAGGISFFARSTTSLAKRARSATETLSNSIRKQSEYQNIQDTINQLQQEIEQGKELSTRKTLIEDALFLQESRNHINEQEQALSVYNPSIARLDTHSSKRLDELTLAHTEAEDRVRSSIQTDEQLRDSFKACAIEESVLQQVDKPGRITNYYSAYKQALQQQQTLQQECSNKNHALAEWEAQHSWLMGEPPTDSTLQGYIHTLKTLAQGCEPLRCAVEANKRLVDELGPAEPIAYSVGELTQAQLSVSRWINLFWGIQTPSKDKEPKRRSKLWLMILVLVLGALGTTLGSLIHPLFFGVSTLLIGMSIFFFVSSPATNRDLAYRERELARAQEEAEKHLAQIDTKTPYPWSSAACQAVVEHLGREIVRTQSLEALNQRRNRAQQRLTEAEHELQRWITRWQDAATDLGLVGGEPLLEGAQFFHFAGRLETWSTLRLAYAQALGAVAKAQQASEDALALVQRELATTSGDEPSLTAEVDSFLERFREALSLQKSLTTSANTIRLARQTLLERHQALAQFWKDVGLPFGSESELKELVSQWDRWNRRTQGLQMEKITYKEKAQQHPEALAMSTAYRADELTHERETIELELQALDEKRERVGGLKATFTSLMFGSELSQAHLQEEQALAQLEAFREEQVQAMMVTKLASMLKQESEERFQPQVLIHASEWFSKITNNRYSLFANDGGFFAKDSVHVENKTLDQLSSGTRIQLLFSIRMAFITMQEESSGVHLPIFLDELLANSDDERALAIAEALAKIAKDRQVFYFTAQSDEVEKLQSIAPSLFTEIPLDTIKTEWRIAKKPLHPVRFTTEQIPPPIDDYQRYAQQLLVAGPSLWEPIESLHSWYLLFDSKQLYEYLQKGWRYSGQLSRALRTSDSSLATRIAMLHKAQELAQRGRSRDVHIEDLYDPSLDIKRNALYWTQIEEVIGPQGVQGEVLLNAIEEKRIQRFSEANQEILYNWLVEHRFFSEERALTSQEILDELFVEFAESLVGSEEEKTVVRWLNGVLG